MSTLKYEAIMVSLSSTEQLHISRFYRDKTPLGEPVFLLHSILHDSSTFYRDDGNGLACYLARHGYDVFVADLRGKGKSRPQINSASAVGSHQAINEDIPALINKIISLRGQLPQIWIGHGWGSVLLCSYYARYGDSVCPVAKMAHFGARRRIVASNFSKKFFIDFMWRRLSWLGVVLHGYMPARFFKLGTSNESRGNYQDYLAWSSNELWQDAVDGFRYDEALLQQQLPPSFYFAASGDKVYGEPTDVRSFIKQLGAHDARLMVLSRQSGNLRDYNHLDMLRHQDCEQDHFPLLLDWLQHS
jgi:predicted alpha/beta hydrolase